MDSIEGSSQTKATFSGLTALIGIIALIVAIISVAVPHWGSYAPIGQSYYSAGMCNYNYLCFSYEGEKSRLPLLMSRGFFAPEGASNYKFKDLKHFTVVSNKQTSQQEQNCKSLKGNILIHC